MPAIINREAHESGKGPRLQKLRAACLLLDSIEDRNVFNAYTAIECSEDVEFNKHTDTDSKRYVEENKNYKEGSLFTFNSHEIINTMVAFADLWVENMFSESLVLGFYTTAGYTKERENAVVKECGVNLPDTPLLRSMHERDFSDEVVDVASHLVKLEYQYQYFDKGWGHYAALAKLKRDGWRDFFSMISWHFGEPDEAQLMAEGIEKVKRSKLYRPVMADREEGILRQILDMIDERQNAKDHVGRFVNQSDVELAFYKGSTQASALVEDPSWRMWDGLAAPEKRNIKEKILDVCAAYKVRKIGIVARKVVQARLGERAYGKEKNYLSLKYQIYQACEDRLSRFFDEGDCESLEPEKVDEMLDALSVYACEAVDELSEDYSYLLSNCKTVEGIVLQLFDECYLRFEEEYGNAV